MKVAILILSDPGTPADLGRVVGALQVASELSQANDEVRIIFDGPATRWVGKLADHDHRYHRLFSRVRPRIQGVCAHCAKAFGVQDEVVAAGLPLLNSYREHPSIRGLAVEGFKVLTF